MNLKIIKKLISKDLSGKNLTVIESKSLSTQQIGQKFKIILDLKNVFVLKTQNGKLIIAQKEKEGKYRIENYQFVISGTYLKGKAKDRRNRKIKTW